MINFFLSSGFVMADTESAIIIPLEGSFNTNQVVSYDSWSLSQNEFRESLNKYKTLLRRHHTTSRSAESHVPLSADDGDERCAGRLPVSSSETDPDLWQIEMSGYRNCMFMYSWLDYMDAADPDDPYIMDTEYKFAFGLWLDRFGEWYQSCLPDDYYAAMWPGVYGDEPTGEDGGLARCETASLDGIETVVACQCYPLSEDYYSTLTTEDLNLVMNGNCDQSNGSDDCVKGAIAIAEERNWGQEMRWMATLMALDDVLDQYTEGIHLSVPDVYYLNANRQELLAEDCTSCQIYAAMRPMPYIQGVNREFIAEDMIRYGRRENVLAAKKENFELGE